MRGHARLLNIKLKTTDQAGNYTEVDRKSQFKGSELPPSSGGTEIPAQNSFRKGTDNAVVAPALSAFWHMLQSLLQLRLTAEARISKPVPAERWQSG